MKFCPHCDRYFRDTVSVCPDDGTPLDDVAPVFTFQPFEGGRKLAAGKKRGERSSPANQGLANDTPSSASNVVERRNRAASTSRDEVDTAFRPADTPHYPYVSDPVPPHDDWETWGGETSGALRLISDPVDERQKKSKGDGRPVRLRETLKSQLTELAAAAFGFGMLGFLLHLVGMTTAKPAHAPMVATTASPAQTLPQPAPAVVPVVPHQAASIARAVKTVKTVPDVKIVEIHRSASVDHKPAPARLHHSPDMVAARGTTPVARPSARGPGVPLSTATTKRIVVAKNASVKAVHVTLHSETQHVRVAWSHPAKARPAVRPPTKLARGPVHRATPSHQVAARHTASPVRVRLARSLEERRWTFKAANPAKAYGTTRIAALPANSIRRSTSDDDPDEEVIGTSSTLSRDRSPSTSTHGPFGLSTGAGDRHVVYVVDASSGMSAHWREAISQVVDSIRSLGPDDTFDVVTFNRRASAFSSTLMPAMPGTEASIVDYLKYVRVWGGSNLQDALWVALRLPEVNEVVIVTDGAPTVGETNPKRLAGFASSENRGGVRIDTVGLVDPSRGWSGSGQLLRQIARDSGGDTRLVSLD